MAHANSSRKGSQTQSEQQWENSIKLAKFFWEKMITRRSLLFFLVDRIVEMFTANVVIATREQDVVSSRAISLEGVAPCSQEETRIFVYARQAEAEGSKVIMVKACDTDVLVIAVSWLPVLQALRLGLEELWIALG